VFAEGEAAYLEGCFAAPEEEPKSQFDLLGGCWADQAVELSAPPRGVYVWAVLREMGRFGIARRVDRHVPFARRIADRARLEERLELLLEPALSIACFCYGHAGGRELRRDQRPDPRANLARYPLHAHQHPHPRAVGHPPLLHQSAHDGAGRRGYVDVVLRIGSELDG